MSKTVQVKEAVKESLVGSEEPVQASVQSKTRFYQYAAKDPATGESYMGAEEFINAVAPVNEDYHRIKREQFGMLFKVADRQNKGRISIADWVSFENLLNKPDAEYEIAFRLFDTERSGQVKYEDFRRLYELNKGPDSLAFDWDCEWAKLYIGSNKKRHAMDYAQFSQLLRGLQGERIRQAFLQFDKDGDGYIEPDDFERIILETTKHKLSDHVLQHLGTLCNITQGSKVSYAHVRAFQNMIKEIDLVELIVRRACTRSTDGKITRTEFLNQAAKITRFSLFTPMEADILFHFASLDEPSGRLGLRDFAKVLDPTWRSPSELAGAGSAALEQTKTKTAAVLSQIFESGYNFALGSLAGAFGAFMVYPIDLVKTRMQNQRKIVQKLVSGEAAAQSGQRNLYENSIDCFRKTLRNEGVRGLYSGVLPQLIGVAPEKAIKLTVNDLVRGYFTDKKSGKIAVPAEVLAGACAGGCQVVFTNPLEIVKIRLQIQGEAVKAAAESGKAPPPKQGAMWRISSLGMRGLYKGASACLARDVPFSGIYFATYNHLKKDLFLESPTKKLGLLQLLSAGAIAGMPAAYLTTPFDVIKTRLQVEARAGQTEYTGLIHAAKTIFKEEGASAFFKGGPARIMRSSPQFGFTLAAYEALQRSIPYPGNQPSKSAKESVSTLREKFDSSPLGRSRNALKIVLDIDENFGLSRLPNDQAWKTLPAVMRGSQ